MNNLYKAVGRASGKVLLVGGYGVLEQNNYGLSLGLRSHFYCVCTEHITKQQTDITVRSFQIEQNWHYVHEDNSIVEKDKKANNFVQNAILWTLKFYQRQKNAGKITLQILFDRNFISNKDALDKQKFCVYRKGYAKTGLGSSACVIVSIVQCLIQIFQPELKSKHPDKFDRLTNVISQISNLSAQKKIGSNFDISTAVYSTQLYKNTLPHKISNLLPNIPPPTIQQLSQIDPQITPIKKPANPLYSYIIDINKGADTRSMVKSFTTQLKKQTKQIQQYFFRTSKILSIELFDTINLFNSQISGQLRDKCKQLNRRHRELQQKYTMITGVPIQPSDLTSLIDNICKNQQVLYSVCPGSGGYDAIFVLSDQQIQGLLSKTVEQFGELRPVQIQFQEQSDITEKQKQQILQFLYKKYQH